MTDARILALANENGLIGRDKDALAFARSLIAATREEVIEECAKIAASHSAARERIAHKQVRKLSSYSEEAQIEIRAEERGEKIAGETIAAAIRALTRPPGD